VSRLELAFLLADVLLAGEHQTGGECDADRRDRNRHQQLDVSEAGAIQV
jgi:hypothetical protein